MHHTFIFSATVVFSWLAISTSLPKFSRDVAMASAGGLDNRDFRHVSEVYKGCFHGNLILDFIAKNAQNWP